MRKKLPGNEKRNSYIGIKVQQKTREQLNFISKRDVIPVSTLIDGILKDYVDSYFKIAKIDWENLPEDERGEGNK